MKTNRPIIRWFNVWMWLGCASLGVLLALLLADSEGNANELGQLIAGGLALGFGFLAIMSVRPKRRSFKLVRRGLLAVVSLLLIANGIYGAADGDSMQMLWLIPAGIPASVLLIDLTARDEIAH